MDAPNDLSLKRRLLEVAALSLRLGFTAFGGPAVHIALIEDEVVTRRKWIDRQHFLDLVAAVNFIPGPNSTELVIHIGLLRAGYPGLITAGVCFILPAMLIILPMAYLYVKYQRLQLITGPLVGIRAAMIAILVAVLWRFAKTSLKDRFTIVLGILAVVAGLFMQSDRFHVPHSELIILAVAAIAGAIYYARPGTTVLSMAFFPLPLLLASSPPTLPAIFLYFLKIGATLFGSGYVLVNYLHSGLVQQHGWLTAQQLTDAIAVGQVTPGPLLTTSTFIGYLLGAPHGHWTAIVYAILATVGIFLPGFIFVAILAPLWSRLRNSPGARGALDGMNAAVTALILVVAINLARANLGSIPAIVICATSLAALLFWNLNSTWILLMAALAGLVVEQIR